MRELNRQKYALVTGAASGMGRAFAEELAARGYGVVLVDRNESAVRCAAEQIAQHHGVPTLVQVADLTRAGVAEELYAATEAAGCEVEVLVCNAGRLLFGGFASHAPAAVEGLVALHCTTHALLCRLYGAAMRARGCGYVLLVSSATIRMAYPSIALYTATKSFIERLGAALHDEWAQEGVRVTVVCPGAVDTPLYALSGRMRRALRRWHVMHRPETIARRGVHALFRGRKRLFPGSVTKVVAVLCRLIPAWVIRRVARMKRVRRLLA